MISRNKRDWKVVHRGSVTTARRDRIAYILKAARSRRPNNVAKIPSGYLIRDCDHYLERP